MNINDLVKEAVAENMETLAAETIDVGGCVVEALLTDSEIFEEFQGGEKEQRSLEATFPHTQEVKLKRGIIVKARGKKWKVDQYKPSPPLITLQLVEPTRQSGVYG